MGHPISQTDPGFADRWQTLSAFDLFVAAWARQECRLEDLCRDLLVPDESWLHRPLEEVVASGLLLFHGGRLGRSTSGRAVSLFRALNFALSYGINYDLYSHPEVEDLLKAAYGKPRFQGRDLPSPEVSAPILRRLIHDGVLLVYSYEPLLARWVPNFFLDEFCAFLGIRTPRHTVSVSPVQARIRRNRLEQFRTPPAAMDVLGETVPDEGLLSGTQRLLRHDLARRSEGLLDAGARRRYEDALVQMRSRVLERSALTRELLCEYHAMLLGEDPTAGRIRTVKVQIPNNPRFKVAPPDQVEPRLERMLEQSGELAPRGLLETLQDTSWLANEFLHIHPFEDGNSRTARVLLAHFLRQQHSALEEISPTFELLFLLATKGASRRSEEALEGVLEDVLLQALNRRDLAALSAGRT